MIIRNNIVFQNDEKVKYDGKEYDGFYISHNSSAAGKEIYGSETTALVLGQMEKFFVLNDNHCTPLEKLAKESLDDCINYVRKNKNKLNELSDKI